jgi:hypothetical protein
MTRADQPPGRERESGPPAGSRLHKTQPAKAEAALMSVTPRAARTGQVPS